MRGGEGRDGSRVTPSLASVRGRVDDRATGFLPGIASLLLLLFVSAKQVMGNATSLCSNPLSKVAGFGSLWSLLVTLCPIGFSCSR